MLYMISYSAVVISNQYTINMWPKYQIGSLINMYLYRPPYIITLYIVIFGKITFDNKIVSIRKKEYEY